jgi:hypothetical protein
MLRYVDQPTYSRSVTVRWPDREDRFSALFRVLPAEEARLAWAVLDAVRAEAAALGEAPPYRDLVHRVDDAMAAGIAAVWAGWEPGEVVDAAGTPLAFTPDLGARLLRFACVRDALWRALTDGGADPGAAEAEARAGN